MQRILFIGRFQPFHLGHLSVVEESVDNCDELIIAIGSSQKSHEKMNPFTYEERKEMIEAVLKEKDITLDKVIIVDIPDIGDDDEWVDHVKSLTPEFDTVYTGAELTEKLFKKAGNEVIPVKFVHDIDATSIRDAILSNEDWKHYVHSAVSDYLEKIEGAKRILEINT